VPVAREQERGAESADAPTNDQYAHGPPGRKSSGFGQAFGVWVYTLLVLSALEPSFVRSRR
jgi:hypothetical protein